MVIPQATMNLISSTPRPTPPSTYALAASLYLAMVARIHVKVYMYDYAYPSSLHALTSYPYTTLINAFISWYANLYMALLTYFIDSYACNLYTYPYKSSCSYCNLWTISPSYGSDPRVMISKGPIWDNYTLSLHPRLAPLVTPLPSLCTHPWSP